MNYFLNLICYHCWLCFSSVPKNVSLFWWGFLYSRELFCVELISPQQSVFHIIFGMFKKNPHCFLNRIVFLPHCFINKIVLLQHCFVATLFFKKDCFFATLFFSTPINQMSRLSLENTIKSARYNPLIPKFSLTNLNPWKLRILELLLREDSDMYLYYCREAWCTIYYLLLSF